MIADEGCLHRRLRAQQGLGGLPLHTNMLAQWALLDGGLAERPQEGCMHVHVGVSGYREGTLQNAHERHAGRGALGGVL